MKINTIKYMMECVFRYIVFCFLWVMTIQVFFIAIARFFIANTTKTNIDLILTLYFWMGFICFPFFVYFIHKYLIKRVFFRSYKNFKLVPKFDKLSFKFTFLTYIQIYLAPYMFLYTCFFKHSFDKNGYIYYILHNIVGDYFLQFFLTTLLISLFFLIRIIKNNAKIID